MTMKERQEKIVQEFTGLKSWEERYKRIIQQGKALPEFPEELKTEDLKVKGCQSQVWIKASLNDEGQVVFQADSDAMIVRGLVALLLRVYSEARPEEILATSPEFIKDLGLQNHLSPSRANGLVAMVKQIKYYAAAFQALQAQASR